VQIEFPDIRTIRQEMGLSQRELAQFLGVSPRTVQSCEQGWRSLGVALEKHLLLLLIIYRRGATLQQHPCWETLACADDARAQCLTYKTRQGHLCWFLTGNQCRCRQFSDWNEKKLFCLQCPVLEQLLAK